MDKSLVRAQSEQDQMWCGLDAWYADHDKENLIEIHHVLELTPSSVLAHQMRGMKANDLNTVARLALHTLRELALRSERNKEPEDV